MYAYIAHTTVQLAFCATHCLVIYFLSFKGCSCKEKCFAIKFSASRSSFENLVWTEKIWVDLEFEKEVASSILSLSSGCLLAAILSIFLPHLSLPKKAQIQTSSSIKTIKKTLGWFILDWQVWTPFSLSWTYSIPFSHIWLNWFKPISSVLGLDRSDPIALDEISQ